MKKAIIIVLALCVIASLCACGGGSTGSSGQSGLTTDGSSGSTAQAGDTSKDDASDEDEGKTQVVPQIGTRVFSGMQCGYILYPDGSLWGWGADNDDQLCGLRSTSEEMPAEQYTTELVHLMDGVADVALGSEHVLVLKSDGSVWGWQNNSCGELGLGNREDVTSPTFIMDDVKAIGAGGQTSFAIKNDGSLWSWGRKLNGQVTSGDIEDYLSPVKLMDDVSSVTGGSNHALVIKTDGSAWGWGWNYMSQLGDGTRDNVVEPIQILENVVKVQAGHGFSLFLKDDGTLWGCGDIEVESPEAPYGNSTVPIELMTDVRDVFCGSYQTFVIKNDGSLWGWGHAMRLGSMTSDEFMALKYGELDEKTPFKLMDDVATAAVGIDFYPWRAITNDGTMWELNISLHFNEYYSAVDECTVPEKILEGLE